MDKSKMSDDQAENLIRKSLTDRMAREPQRGSTFFAIQKRLNEQDGPGLRKRLSGISELAFWRLVPVSKSQIGSITAVAAIVVVVALFIMLSGPDANDAEEIVPAVEPTSTAVTDEPTAIPEPKIPEVAVTTLEVPESGSDEEKILAVIEQQVRAMNTQNYESFTSTCPPGVWKNDQKTWDRLATFWDTGGILKRQLLGFTYESFNARNIAFKSYNDGSVESKFDVYSYDTLLTEGWSWWWEEFEGEWYSTSATCTGATGRQT
ncbi:hypothetical protein JYU04_03810 [Dehalococcoides mccartyi]|nr:hypothetical protein [Dehalococcoides mccartyi]